MQLNKKLVNWAVSVLTVIVLAFSFGCTGGGGGAVSDIEKIASEILETQNSGRQYYENLVFQDDPDPIQKTIDYLKAQQNVADAGIAEDNVSIWIQYDTGVEGVILTESFKSFGDITSPSAFQDSGTSILNKRTFFSSMSATNRKAIILLPIDSEPNYEDTSVGDIETRLIQNGYSVEIYRDEDVTVDLMETLSDYDFIYMSTHGGINFGGVDIGGITWNVSVMTGEEASSNAMTQLWHWLVTSSTSGLMIVSPPLGGKSYFALNQNFFKNYSYPDTFVYMNACSSLKYESLADAFLDNGASVYLGWDNISFLAFGILHNPEFFEELSKPNNTLQQAYDGSLAQYYPATIFKDTNRNGQYRVLLLNGEDLGDAEDTAVDYALKINYKGNSEYIFNLQQESGIISGSVKDAVTHNPLQGVFVDVYSEDSLIAMGTTDANGIYSLSVPARSGYEIEFSKVGYLTSKYFNITVEADTTTHLEAVLQIDGAYAGQGNVSGQILNALDGIGVSGLTINLREGINVTTGSIIATTTTQAGGSYSFTNLNAGHYTAEVSGAGYNTTYFTVICIGDTTTANQDATITPILAEGETRIVLTWIYPPSDLDSHLTGPISGSINRFHVYWAARGSATTSPYAALDLDNVSRQTDNRPETITIYQQFDGVYRYSVHDYSNLNSTNSYALSNSNAQVRVYRSGNLVATFNVPANQEGTLWTVFELNGDIITPINAMSYQSSSSTIMSVFPERWVETDAELMKNLPDKK